MFFDSKRKSEQPSYSRANRETSVHLNSCFFFVSQKSLDSNERLEQLLLSFFREFRKSFDYFYIFPTNQSRTSIRRPYPNGRETCVVADFPSSEFRKTFSHFSNDRNHQPRVSIRRSHPYGSETCIVPVAS